MADPTFKQLLQTGGGNIQYVFHVSGYPWAVCTSQDCATQLDNPLHVTARRTIFGIEEDTGDYWADDTSLCPIFPTLKSTGKQSLKLHEGKGEITGGNWRVQIWDRELGHTWEHGGSTIFRGLPGVHHVLGPDYDSSVGWAYLTSNLEIGDTSFTVQEQSNTTLKDGIDAASSFPHRLLWINQECIAVDNTDSVSGKAYTIEVSEDASDNKGRGLFRSKHQNHYTEYYSDADPIVTDTPFSIIDKPCWLWAVALNDDGTDILMNPVCVRSGTVSPNISTRDGVTTIGIISPFKQLDYDVKTPVFIEHLSRYVFTRQEEEASQALQWNRQAPHLAMLEFDASGVATRREIWIANYGAAATEVVDFDNKEDVLWALNEELSLCSLGDSSQLSSTRSGDVTLDYYYSIENGQITQCAKDATVPVYYRTLISGPLAWLFNLGPVFNKQSEFADPLGGLGSSAPWFFRRHEFTYDTVRTALKRPWMVCNVTQSTADDSNFAESDEDIRAATRLVPQDAWITPFFYQFPYETDHIKNFSNLTNKFEESYVNQLDIPDGDLFFKKDADLSNINVGDTFIIGRETDWHLRPRFLKGTISAKGTDGGDSGDYPYVTVSSSVLYRADTTKSSPIKYGVGLWYIPALEEDPEELEATDMWSNPMVGPSAAINRNDPTLPFQMTIDPLIFTQQLRGESNIISDPFRAVLGDDGASYALSSNLTLSDIIGFSDESTEDVDTWIDWDSLDDYTGLVLPGKQYYGLSVGSKFNLWRNFKNELIFHGIQPTWEWDDSLGHFIMRFREISPINFTEANESGREIDEDMILRNSQMTETHNDSWMFNKVLMRCNSTGSEYRGNLSVDLVSGNIRNRNSARTLNAESQLTYIRGIKNLSDSDIGYICKRYTNMLRQLAVPQANYTVKTNLSAMVDIAIGRECLITDSAGFYPYTHERGLTAAAGFVTGLTVDLDKCECTVTARLTKERTKGFAPACYVTSSAKSGGDTVTCTCTANYFTPSGGRWDCTYFDCYTYNKSTGVYTARNCSCGNYAVIAFARNDSGSSWEPTLMYFDVTSVDTTDGNSIVLVDQDSGAANYTAWDTADEHIIIFAEYDDCETCQQRYLFFADDDDLVGTENARAGRWE